MNDRDQLYDIHRRMVEGEPLPDLGPGNRWALMGDIVVLPGHGLEITINNHTSGITQLDVKRTNDEGLFWTMSFRPGAADWKRELIDLIAYVRLEEGKGE